MIDHQLDFTNKVYSFNCVSKNYGLARQEIYTTLFDVGAKIERVQEGQEKNLGLFGSDHSKVSSSACLQQTF